MSNARLLAQHATTQLGYRNKIINGRMNVDQRRLALSSVATIPNVAATMASFVADRWLMSTSMSNRVFYLKEATSLMGANWCCYMTSNSTAAIATGDFARLMQSIEGNDIADLEWGTANAKPVTISFWAHATVAGQYSVALGNNTATRTYPATFTLAASQWTLVTITVPGCTDGTWPTNESVSLIVQFSIGCGSQYTGPANAWASTNYVGATGNVNLLTTAGALRIAKVQLESGSFATPFEFRPQEVENMLCRRWYQLRGDFASNFALGRIVTQGQIIGSALEQTMRATPYVRVGVDNNDGALVVYNSIDHSTVINDITKSTFTFSVGSFSGFVDYKAYDVSCEA